MNEVTGPLFVAYEKPLEKPVRPAVFLGSQYFGGMVGEIPPLVVSFPVALGKRNTDKDHPTSVVYIATTPRSETLIMAGYGHDFQVLHKLVIEILRNHVCQDSRVSTHMKPGNINDNCSNPRGIFRMVLNKAKVQTAGTRGKNLL